MQTVEQPLIVTLLEQQGILDLDVLTEYRAQHAGKGLHIEQLLVAGRLATEEQVARAYANHLFIPLFEPEQGVVEVDSVLRSVLSEKTCRDLLIAPVALKDNVLDLVLATPNELLILDEIQLQTGYQVRPMIGRLSVIDEVIVDLYGGSHWSRPEIGGGSVEGLEHYDGMFGHEHGDNDGDSETLHLDQPTPPGREGRVIRLVNQLLMQALQEGASDIHLEPYEDTCQVRFRVDGALNRIAEPTRSLFVPIVSRLKVLAKMDIAEKRVPQDGAISLRSADREIDIRVNSIPTVHGEKLCLRILDKGALPSNISTLGLSEAQTADLTESLHMPHGLILVTGPTGSGKSSTLYSCLQLLNQPDTNICTAEDPVEYRFGGINQVQVRNNVGLTFAAALRSFLRQDPDVIMLGEIRDQETADIALRAALTGHLVLSTIHTNDALSAVARLKDMDIDGFVLGSTLRVLEAQRLVRRLCDNCKQPWDCDSKTASRFGIESGTTLYRPAGCDECRGIGYRGRTGVFEVVRLTSAMKELIQDGAAPEKLRGLAREQGCWSLFDSALDKVRQGITSLEIALSVRGQDD